MIKYRNKRRSANNNTYSELDCPYIYNDSYSYKNYFHRNCNYNKLKYIKQKKCCIESEKNNFLSKIRNYDDVESFYPKNYPQRIETNIVCTDDNEKINKFIIKDSNRYYNYENLGKNSDNFFKNDDYYNQAKASPLLCQNMKNDTTDINKNDNLKSKKFAIKIFPHQKRKKGYPIKKKLFNYKEEEINKKTEDLVCEMPRGRKLSFNLSQNSDTSTKQSLNTLNSSIFSSKDKSVSENLIIKNKFDENNDINETNNALIQPCQPINKYLENTEILKIVVKISETETVVCKIKRYDDLFFTLNLFCEINSIDEKFMKPIIIRVLKALNMIYQIYNSDLSEENVDILRKIKMGEINKE